VISGDVRDRVARLEHQPHAPLQQLLRYFLDFDMTVEISSPSGEHPGIEVSVETGLAHAASIATVPTRPRHRSAGDGSPLVAPLARSRRGGQAHALLPLRSLEPPAPLTAAVGAGARASDLPAQDRLGTEADRGRHRLLPLDGVEGAAPVRISRKRRPAKEQPNRYEWPCTGDLLHMDTSRYARFLRPGHRVTSDRSQRQRKCMRPQTRVGYDYAHAIVDDHSRLAYVELHGKEKAATVTGLVERALAFFAEQGIVAKRLMTDNALAAWSFGPAIEPDRSRTSASLSGGDCQCPPARGCRSRA
jgi:hypothetical protein